MYKDLINEEVTILVATKGDIVLEYNGTLVLETDNEIELKDATISTMLMNVQRSVFGSNMTKYREDIDKVVVNKKFIISCIK
ncbi:MAG: hypothetical protein IKE10_01455 [Bacilli bacterium]|nr:hypothetical protein [Bacilli bacterium]